LVAARVLRFGSRCYGKSMRGLRFAWVALAAAAVLPAQSLHLASFDKVWTTIRDTHWQKEPGGLDWEAMRAEYRPRVERSTSIEQTRGILQEMLGRLGQTHFAIVPGGVYAALDKKDGGPAVSGISLRVLDGEAVVTSVDPDSPAFQAGVRAGWIFSSVDGERVKPLIAQALGNPQIHELQVTRAIAARLSGAPGATIHAAFLNRQDQEVAVDLRLGAPRGQLAVFGNLPPTFVSYEERRIGPAAYFRFNIFLDIPRIIPAFERTLKGCGGDCRGLILDLRGNPGGIAGMAMGMAGFLVEEANHRLGTMYLRESSLNFVINPRPEVFAGRVAILMDGNSASTSEILAGGLQDLGRARVFGTHSAAAALPSMFERLPDGDGFQYAIANYLSVNGKALEGIGVTPDVEVKLTREALLAGRDPVIEAALSWIESERNKP